MLQLHDRDKQLPIETVYKNIKIKLDSDSRSIQMQMQKVWQKHQQDSTNPQFVFSLFDL